MSNKAKLSDAADLKEIHTQAVMGLGRFYSKEALDVWTSGSAEDMKKIIKYASWCYLLRHEVTGKVLGFASIKNNNMLWHLYILPKYQKQGHGQVLLAAAEKYLKEQKQKEIVLDANLSAEGFYEKYNYRKKFSHQIMMKDVPVSVQRMTKIL